MNRRNWRHFDWPLLVAVILVSILGVIMMVSAVQGDPHLATYPRRQAIYVLVGLALLLTAALVDYHLLASFTVPLYGLVLVLLALVGVLGKRLFGAQSWLDVFGLFPVQPSELAKVALALALARYLAARQEQIGRLGTMAGALLIAAPILVFVFLEPDLGMTIVLAVELGFLLFVAGIRWSHLAGGVVGLVAAAPLFWSILQDHQRTRLRIFLDPTADPNSYFNVQQALVSVGSGGLLGKGFGQGTQSQLHFLRVRHTDFIFSVIAEELGFIGACVLLVLLLFILWRLWRVAEQARDPYGRLLVVAVAAVILFQTVVNIGMNMALVPVTGLPLPFVSYGGNAMLSFFLMIGLAESVAMRKQKIDF
jgi:rod shape determining protein RodA